MCVPNVFLRILSSGENQSTYTYVHVHIKGRLVKIVDACMKLAKRDERVGSVSSSIHWLYFIQQQQSLIRLRHVVQCSRTANQNRATPKIYTLYISYPISVHPQILYTRVFVSVKEENTKSDHFFCREVQHSRTEGL